MKKVFSILLSLVLSLSLLTACGGGVSSGSDESGAGDGYTIGVVQYAPHPSLDNCYNGFIAGLKEAGIEEGKNLTVEFVNANGSSQDAELAAKNLATKKPDMLLGVATPAAMALYSAAKGTDIPVIFNAVSDPVSAKLVNSLESPGNNCTGTSDLIPAEAMLKLIKAFLPDAAKVGVLYTTSEPNSLAQLELLKTAAASLGLTIVEQGITNESEVASGAQALVSKGVDCIQNTTDNNVVNNLSVVLKAAKDAGIPVFGSEVEQVKNGCIACEGIDYLELGRQTGLLAAKILKGEATAADTAVIQVSDSSPAYSETVMKEFGITLPDSYKNAEKVD